MNYLGIGLITEKVVYSIIRNNNGLKMEYGVVEIPYNFTEQQQVAFVYRTIVNLIRDNEISFVVNKWVGVNKAKRYEAFDIVRLKERILLACGETKAIFVEPDTYGWEIYMGEHYRTKNKLHIIHKTYNVNLYKDLPNRSNKLYNEIANTIIITEGIALGRILGKNNSLIDYDYKLIKNGGG